MLANAKEKSIDLREKIDGFTPAQQFSIASPLWRVTVDAGAEADPYRSALAWSSSGNAASREYA
jgi:hypothetical protein